MLSQVQHLDAGALLDTTRRRVSGWAKEAKAHDPSIVLNLSSLPAGVTKFQKVCAVTMMVPHSCRERDRLMPEEVLASPCTCPAAAIAPNPVSAAHNSPNHPHARAPCPYTCQ